MSDETQCPGDVFRLFGTHEISQFLDWPASRPDVVLSDVCMVELAERDIDVLQSSCMGRPEFLHPCSKCPGTRLVRHLARAESVWLSKSIRLQAEFVETVEHEMAFSSDLFTGLG